jgi:hypothetical protein
LAKNDTFPRLAVYGADAKAPLRLPLKCSFSLMTEHHKHDILDCRSPQSGQRTCRRALARYKFKDEDKPSQAALADFKHIPTDISYEKN